MSRWHKTLPFVFASTLIGFQSAHASSASAITPAEHDRLRARLERIYYEQDLMIRNQKVDRSDVKHQEQEFEALKVFERIPFREDIPGLRASLTRSSEERGLKLKEFSLRPVLHKKVPTIPSRLRSDEDPNFKLTDEQITASIPFEAVVEGNPGAVQAWIRSWPEDQMRIAVPDEAAPRQVRPGQWAIRAHAFKFREAKFPTLEPREPLELLPRWARQNPDRFAQAEPILWSYVTRTHAISSEARPLFSLRQQLLLNGARMSFFVSRAAPRDPTN